MLLFSFFLVSCSPSSDKEQGYTFFYDDKSNSCFSGNRQGLNSELGECSDLKNQTLKDVNFSGKNLKGVDFSYSYLENVDFSNAQLQGAKFYNVIIKNCKFDSSILSKTVFKDVSIQESSFIESSGENIEMISVNIDTGDFSGVVWPKLIIKDTKLIQLNFSNATLNNSYWQNSIVEASIFLEANFEKSFFENVDFSSIGRKKIESLQDPSFLEQQNLVVRPKFNDLQYSNLKNSIIKDSFFSLADLKGSQLQRLEVVDSNFQGADLSYAALVYAKFYQVDFSSIEVLAPNVTIDPFLIKNLGNKNVLYNISKLNEVVAVNVEFKNSLFYAVEGKRSNFSNANWAHSIVLNSYFDQSYFIQNGLFQAYFKDTSLKFTDFSHSNLGVEIFSNAPENHTVYFLDSVLDNSNFSNAVLTFFNVNDNSIKGPSFKGTTLKFSSWVIADLRKASFKSSNLESAQFNQAFLQGASFNVSTVLPFSTEEALNLGMILE